MLASSSFSVGWLTILFSNTAEASARHFSANGKLPKKYHLKPNDPRDTYQPRHEPLPAGNESQPVPLKYKDKDLINSPIVPGIAWSGLGLDVDSLGQVLDGLSVVVALETHLNKNIYRHQEFVQVRTSPR